MILPVLAGLAWNASGLPLPGFADEILATLGQAVVPLCLVLIGVSLAHYGVSGALRGAVALSLREAARPAAARCSLFARFVLRPDRRAARDRGPDGGAAGRQQCRCIFAQRYQTLPAETSTAIVVSTLAFVAPRRSGSPLLQAIG